MIKNNKIFSIRNELAITFSILIIFCIIIMLIIVMTIVEKAIMNKVQLYVTDKSLNSANLIESRIKNFMKSVAGFSHISAITDDSVLYNEKAKILANEVKGDKNI